MANKDLTLALRIKAIVEGAASLAGLRKSVKDLGTDASKPIPDPTPPMREGARKTTDRVNELTNALGGLVGLAAIQQFVRTSVNEFSKAESAFRGLEAVANHSGVGIGRAMQEAEKLASDGLMTVAESSKALQNLLSRGYNVDQAVGTIERLKDAAAYNRSASLSMGEAVTSATEGLKNENSILVDNAGVTKNVSVLWKEFAASIGKSVTELSQAEKVQAEYLGIQRETEAQLGNAAKAADGFGGQMSKADAEMKKFGASMGQMLAPVMAGLARAGIWLVNNVAKPLVFFFQSLGVELARDIEILGIFKDALLDLNFSGVGDKIDAAFERADEQLMDLAKNLDSGALNFQPIGDSAKKAAGDTTEAAAEMGKAMQRAAKDRKESVNEQVKDAEKLRNSLIKAFSDSIRAEAGYRAQAKKLRAEASQRPADDDVEGQASALLDLIAAEQKLQRLKATAPLEDVQAQAELVEQLAGRLNDQARSQEAVNRAKLAEADALDKAANEEAARQAGITEQQKLNDERLAAFTSMLKDLEAGKTVAIGADTEQASTALEQVKVLWDAIQDKTVVLTVQQTGGAAASPGDVPGFANGGILPGYGGGDRRLILAEDGEAITNKRAVAYYGRSFMAQLNAMRLPRFANGGIVSSVASSTVSPGASGLQPVTLNMPGAGSYPMSASPNVVAELRAALAIEAIKRGRRR